MSNYDVIETFLSGEKKKLVPASIVQKEGDLQFTKYLPIEQAEMVQPKFDGLVHYVDQLYRHGKRIQQDFIRCGYFLNLIKREGLYRYCVEEGSQGYTNFYRFCEDKLGISQKTAQRLVSINVHFCGNDVVLPEAYEKYSASKLAIMSTFKNGLEGKMDPSVTVATLMKLSKYYASHDWEVDLDTTWREDLKAFEDEKVEAAKHKSQYLRGRKFKSAKSEDGPKRYVSDEYKAVTRFLDQTMEELAKIKNGKNSRFEKLLKELESGLKEAQTKVLRLQSEDMTDGL